MVELEAPKPKAPGSIHGCNNSTANLHGEMTPSIIKDDHEPEVSPNTGEHETPDMDNHEGLDQMEGIEDAFPDGDLGSCNGLYDSGTSLAAEMTEKMAMRPNVPRARNDVSKDHHSINYTKAIPTGLSTTSWKRSNALK
jgi:hypothetical protein